MIDIWICEDNADDALRLEQLLENHLNELHLPYSLKRFSSAAQLQDTPVNADLVFMDIELGDDDGIALAQKIHQSNPSCVIILQSAFPHYSIEGYKSGAIRFLLKPVSRQALSEALDPDMLQKMAVQDYVQVDEISEHPLPTASIRYIEVVDRQTIIHTARSTYETGWTLHRWKTMLEPSGFVQCYKSILVSVAWIDRISDDGRDLILKGGGTIPLSRHYRRQVQQACREYVWMTF